MELKKMIYAFMIYTLCIISILLFSKRKRHISITLLGFYSLFQIICVGSFFLRVYGEYIYRICPQLFFSTAPFLAVIIPLFFLFIKTSIHPDSEIKKSWMGHFVLFIVLLIYTLVNYWIKPDAQLQELLSSNSKALKIESTVLTILFNLQYLVYSILLLKELKQITNKKQVLIHTVFNQRLLKITIYTYTGGFLLSMFTNFINYLDLGKDFDFNFLNSLYFYFFFLFMFYFTIKGFNNKEVFKYTNTDSNPNDLELLYERITRNVEKAQPFVEPLITLKQFADSMNEHPRLVSQAINHVFGSNFNDFMNYHRVELAKQKLFSMQHLTIQEIMYESGFNSKAAFNKAFKKFTNHTPTEYKQEVNSYYC